MKPPNKNINGHSFTYSNKPAYCDNCEQFMWVLTKPSIVRCKKCKYACHECCMTLSEFQCPRKKNKTKKEQARRSVTFTPYILSKDSKNSSNSKSFIKGIISNFQDEKTRLGSKSYENLSTLNTKLTDTISSIDENTKKGKSSGCSSATSLSAGNQTTKQIEMSNPNKFTPDEIFKRVFLYNRGSSGLAFTMCQDSCNFRGFLRIQINLTRPVNIKADPECMTLKRALSSTNDSDDISKYASVNHNIYNLKDTTNGMNNKNNFKGAATKHWVKQTFIIPKGTNTALHVRSDTTSREIISTLLRKYNILGNPLKYSLCVIEKESGNLNFTKTEIPDNACPLMLLLEWGPLDETHIISFSEKILKDNLYEHFSIPELMNFYKIITTEKLKAIKKVDEKFSKYGKALNKLLLSST